MRAVIVVSFLALLCPAVALAQTTAAPAAAPASAPENPAPKKGDITRDQYIERAKRNAEARFDRLDTDHDGVLTVEERRAARAAPAKPKSPPSQ